MSTHRPEGNSGRPDCLYLCAPIPTGQSIQRLEALTNYVTSGAINRARERSAHLPNVHFEQSDMLHLPKDLNGRFDLVLVLDVLYYLASGCRIAEATSRAYRRSTSTWRVVCPCQPLLLSDRFQLALVAAYPSGVQRLSALQSRLRAPQALLLGQFPRDFFRSSTSGTSPIFQSCFVTPAAITGLAIFFLQSKEARKFSYHSW